MMTPSTPARVVTSRPNWRALCAARRVGARAAARALGAGVKRRRTSRRLQEAAQNLVHESAQLRHQLRVGAGGGGAAAARRAVQAAPIRRAQQRLRLRQQPAQVRLLAVGGGGHSRNSSSPCAGQARELCDEV